MKRVFEVVVAAVLTMAATGSVAQTYPDRPVRLVNPFPTGGSGDTVARIVFERVSSSLGVPVIVESRVGGGGSIGTGYVAKSDPDGYTLSWGTSSTFAVNPGIQKNLPYDPVKDFTPIAMIVKAPWLLLVNPSVPASSLPELIAYSRANPGKLNYGSYGPGTSNHLAFELLRSVSGLDALHIPYKGGNPMLTALLGGEIQATLDLPATVMSYIKAGRLKLLGVASSKRFPLMPDTATLAEQGHPIDAGSWFAVLGPANLPAPIVERLNREINKALAQPDIRDRLVALGNEVVGGPPSVLAATMAREAPLWKKVVDDRNIKLD
jgi:tripartite-type tricarboxylate transporter receptor subunit TctC